MQSVWTRTVTTLATSSLFKHMCLSCCTEMGSGKSCRYREIHSHAVNSWPTINLQGRLKSEDVASSANQPLTEISYGLPKVPKAASMQIQLEEVFKLGNGPSGHRRYCEDKQSYRGPRKSLKRFVLSTSSLDRVHTIVTGLREFRFTGYLCVSRSAFRAFIKSRLLQALR